MASMSFRGDTLGTLLVSLGSAKAAVVAMETEVANSAPRVTQLVDLCHKYSNDDSVTANSPEQGPHGKDMQRSCNALHDALEQLRAQLTEVQTRVRTAVEIYEAADARRKAARAKLGI